MYQERAPRAQLRDCVVCAWNARASGNPSDVLPDGCVDIVWAPGREPWIAGPDTRARSASVARGTVQAGIRFIPGAAAALLGVPIPELLDRRVPVTEFWPRQIVSEMRERLEDSRAPADAAVTLEDYVLRRLADAPEPDRLVRAAVAAITQSVAARARPLVKLASQAGISERQLRRRFVAAIGYGPKMFERVVRFQHFRHLATTTHRRGLAWLAADVGYADQSHLSRECARLAGATPRALALRLSDLGS